MKHLGEFRDAATTRRLLSDIAELATRPWSIMEVCGGQTHSLIHHGLDRLLPPAIEMIHGPGCPVCVTPAAYLDRAIAIAMRPEVILCSFGDMLRVPGSRESLLAAKARGADVRVVYSPLDAVRLAEATPDREIVFLAIGFETTAPANAMAVKLAHHRGLGNFSMLVSQVLVPPAIEAILRDPSTRVDAFLAAGHVAAVMGTGDYPELATRYRVPIVVTGFEPVDLLEGIRRTVLMLEEGRFGVDNAYPRAVSDVGNPVAKSTIHEVFQVCDQQWRGLGWIPQSGWELAPVYAGHDAATRFPDDAPDAKEPTTDATMCRSGDVLRGVLKPSACPLFGKECTPQSPLGATMVSSEGACAAYFHAGR
jgi:hydrogenase expression/formation protein HypD